MKAKKPTRDPKAEAFRDKLVALGEASESDSASTKQFALAGVVAALGELSDVHLLESDPDVFVAAHELPDDFFNGVPSRHKWLMMLSYMRTVGEYMGAN